MKICLDDKIDRIISYWLFQSMKKIRYKMKYHKIINVDALKRSKNWAFVIGNGPSSKEINWNDKKVKNILEKSDIISTNSFFLNDFADDIWPHIHIMSDPDWLISVPDDIISRLGEDFYSGVLKNEKILRQKSPMVLIPAQYASNNLPQELNQIYFNDFEHHYSGQIGNLLKPRIFCSMTGIKALNTAFALGYERIIFCGLDASQFKGISFQSSGNLQETYLHSYSYLQEVQVSRSMGNFSIKELMYIYYKQFRDFDLLSEFSQKNGIEVFNVGPSSMVGSFERKKIDEIV